MRLNLDENLGRRWVDKIRDAGHEADTVHAEALTDAADVAVIEATVAAGRALVTLDLDFANPLRLPPEQAAGIAVLRVRHRPGRTDLDLVVERLIGGLEHAELAGRLWVIEPDRIRKYEAADDPDRD
ncbi:MAG: DUF5615 family PIN-like protein [Acidimicrobiales bacterium]